MKGEFPGNGGGDLCTDVDQSQSNALDESRLPTIVVNNRQLRDVLHDAWAAVHAWNNPPQLFRFKEFVVEVVRFNGPPRIRRMNSAALNGVLMEVANWVRRTARGDVPARMPGNVTRIILAIPDQTLPEIKGIALAEITDREGYDPKTRLWLYRTNNSHEENGES